MKALITGASSGIGEQMAYVLSEKGYELILVARREERLLKVKEKIGGARIICTDVSKKENCIKLYNEVKDEDIDVLINNAGFGIFGEFCDIDIDREVDMINTNIIAVDVLTKLFLRDFIKKDRGYILNVASSAAFGPGPLLSSYYASKAYVLRLTEAIWRELKEKKSSVVISALCPGPVKTEFDSVADVSFSLKGLEPSFVARYAIEKMFKKKTVIVPSFIMKMARIGMKILPELFLTRFSYKVQKKKKG